jgi:hypothetical protein
LSGEVKAEQLDLVNQLNEFKSKHDDLTTKVKQGEDEQNKLKRQKFLVTALQLKCKKLV